MRRIMGKKKTTPTVLGRMSPCCTHFDPPSPLPQLLGPRGTEPSTDLDNDLAQGWCRKCEGAPQIPPSLLDQHRDWHARTNLLLRLKALIVKMTLDVGGRGPSIRPGDQGTLVVLNYEDDGDEKIWKVTSAAGDEDLGDYLNSTCRNLLNLTSYEGLKVTVGNKFVGRRWFGDFFILNLDLPPVSREEGAWSLVPKENYFELECYDGILWIRPKVPNSSRTKVSLNGVPLPFDNSSCGAQVFYGDVISISIPDGKERGKRGCDLILKPCNPNPSEDEPMETEEVPDVQTASGHPLANSLILENVFRFVPTSMIKDLRLVSPMWNEEALKIIKGWGAPVSVFKPEDLNFLRHSLEADTAVIPFAVSGLVRVKLPHWKLELPCIGCDENQPINEHEDHIQSMKVDRYVEELGAFLGQPLHAVKTLTLSGIRGLGVSHKGWKIFHVVISGLKGTLTTLSLTLGIGDDASFRTIGFEDLPLLLRLSLSLHGMPQSNKLSTFGKHFIKCVGSIQHLSLDILNGNAWNSVYDTRMILQEVRNLQSIHPSKFTEFQSLVLRRSSEDMMLEISFLKRDNLTKLEMFEVDPAPYQFRSPPLGLALSTHMNSLTELSLHFKVGRILTIDFPQWMQNLTSLSLRFQFETDDICDVEVRFGGGDSGSIDYSLRFPSLSKLLLWPVRNEEGHNGWPLVKDEGVSWSPFHKILVAFFNTGMNGDAQPIPVASVTTLDIPFLLQEKYDRILDCVESTFPKVNFPPSLASAREAEVWEPPVRPGLGHVIPRLGRRVIANLQPPPPQP